MSEDGGHEEEEEEEETVVDASWHSQTGPVLIVNLTDYVWE